jgi:catechol 2,3-dioxygenase-like lactoylglutathione lyase family enzyme
MLDHFNLPVSDLERSRRFYEEVLATLDCRFVLQDGSAIGFGRDCWNFGIVLVTNVPLPRIHLAFSARDRQQVDRFYEAALAAGGISNGRPGIRSDYDPHYYAAFVLDPDGHNVEAVFRRASHD